MERHRCMGCMSMTENEVCEKCGWPDGKTNEPHQLPTGYVLHGQYRIGRVLGQGGFGITYLGWDDDLEVPVAIKEFFPNSIVNRDCSVSPEIHCYSEQVVPHYLASKERFLREAKALARFEAEPAIVRIRNFFLENETAYIVMEYVRGTDLASYVDRHGGKLQPKETLMILRPVMEALAAVHEEGLVHRDISPDNIMLHPRDGAKLLDFGAVRAVEGAEAGKDLERSTEAILKRGFAPMEQYHSRGDLGPWTDEYALCATVYYCLTGRIPEEAPTRMIEESEIDWDIPGLTVRQQAALRKGMSLRSKDRHGSIRVLLRELYTEETADPEEETTPTSQEKPRSGKKRLRIPVAIACAAVAVLVAAYLLRPEGWMKIGQERYYFVNGLKLCDSWLEEGEARYYFDGKGKMVTGWLSNGGMRYWFDENGVMFTGWLGIGEDRYYFDTDGSMVTGKYTIGEDRYYFGDDGRMWTGTLVVDGSAYLYGADGIMHTGWHTDGDARYYFDLDGRMLTGLQEIQYVFYYFGEQGVMETDWQIIDGDRYRFAPDGTAYVGMQIFGEDTYYFHRYGKMHTGWLELNDSEYYFFPDGKMATGEVSIDGMMCYFSHTGRRM